MFKVTVIGCGKMGSSIVKALLSGENFLPEEIVCCDHHKDNLCELDKLYGVVTTSDILSAIKGCELIILAVKPNAIPLLARELQGKLEGQLILSIAAGVTLKKLQELFKYERVVRSMPNLAVQVALSTTVWIASKELNEDDIRKTEIVLNSLGSSFRVYSEDLIDTATAIAGSGPAYQYLFMEALVEAGVRLGLSRELAYKLTLNMVKGSVSLAEINGEDFAALRYKVTTPGGTTAEALYSLEKNSFRASILEAAKVCYERSRELAKVEH
ncbi:pyrroline-5-carboxylate reductase [bacterium]|nr:pyrroline-5-carboxylate reductase [bacterium]